MTIKSTDLAFLESEELSDFDTGGGQATGRVVVDGEMNNVFWGRDTEYPLGRISLRKIFAAVRTESNEAFRNVRLFLSKGPDDSGSSSLFYSTGSAKDRRGTFQTYIEKHYMVGAPHVRWRLNGIQQPGTNIINVYAYNSEIFYTLTPPGEIWINTNKDNETVKVIGNFDSRTEGSFWFLSVLIDRPLTNTWEGSDPVGTTVDPGPDKITLGVTAEYIEEEMYSIYTVGIDDPAYFSIASLKEDATIGATTITINGPNYEKVQWAPFLSDPWTPQSIATFFNVRLLDAPVDGINVPFISGNTGSNKNRTIIVHQTFEYAIETDPPTAGMTVDLSHEKIGKAYIVDSLGAKLPESDTTYSVDKRLGVITFANPVILYGFTGPYTVIYRVQDESFVNSIDSGGVLHLAYGLRNSYDHDLAMVSSTMLVGDLQAHVLLVFEQNTWLNNWADSITGDAPSQGAQYDNVTYPIQTSNLGTSTERIRLSFKTTTTVDIIGESYGTLARSVSILTDVHVPSRIADDTDMMVIPAAGFGGGWQPGNQIRINLQGALFPIEVLRCDQPSDMVGTEDSIVIEMLGADD